jgi:hypothetical protein
MTAGYTEKGLNEPLDSWVWRTVSYTIRLFYLPVPIECTTECAPQAGWTLWTVSGLDCVVFRVFVGKCVVAQKQE